MYSNAKDAYGLVRAASHSPPIPATSFSPYNFQKLHPELFAEQEAEIKLLGDKVKAGDVEVKDEWSSKKRELAAQVKPLYQIELARRVRETKPDLIVLAGFMLILLPGTLETLTRDWVEEADSEGISAEGTTSTLGASPYPEPLAKGTSIPIINLHPALPGSFVGPHVIEDAWEAFNQRKLPSGEEEIPTAASSTTFTTSSTSSTPSPGEPIKALADALASTSLSSSSSAESPSAPAPTEAEPSPFGPKITKTGIMIHRVIPELDRGEPVLWREIPMKEGEGLEALKERIHAVEHGAIVDAVEQVTRELGTGEWWK